MDVCVCLLRREQEINHSTAMSKDEGTMEDVRCLRQRAVEDGPEVRREDGYICRVVDGREENDRDRCSSSLTSVHKVLSPFGQRLSNFFFR